jgi:hypothetical protein
MKTHRNCNGIWQYARFYRLTELYNILQLLTKCHGNKKSEQKNYPSLFNFIHFVNEQFQFYSSHEFCSQLRICFSVLLKFVNKTEELLVPPRRKGFAKIFLLREKSRNNSTRSPVMVAVHSITTKLQTRRHSGRLFNSLWTTTLQPSYSGRWLLHCNFPTSGL